MRSPKTFEREPTTIEAIQWTGQNIDAIGDFGCTVEHYGGMLRLFVQANQTWLPLEVGEWIARDEHGYYPIKDGGDRPSNYREVHKCRECGCTWEIDGPMPCPECSLRGWVQ
jgi:hypothetical protein